MEAIHKYIIKKLELLLYVKKDRYSSRDRWYIIDRYLDRHSDYDCFFEILEKAVYRLSEKKGWSFPGFFNCHGDDFFEKPYEANDFLPKDITEEISKPGEDGLYVHMVNKKLDETELEEFVEEIKSLEGEICVSDIGDEQFSLRKEKLGLVFSGRPTKTFGCDCWSKIKEDGKRYATRSDSYSERSESWLVPACSKIEYVVYSAGTRYLAEKIASIAESLRLYVLCGFLYQKGF